MVVVIYFENIILKENLKCIYVFIWVLNVYILYNIFIEYWMFNINIKNIEINDCIIFLILI